MSHGHIYERGQWRSWYAAIIIQNEKDMRDLKKRVAMLESEWAPIENLPILEKYRAGMRMFGE
jgi:hypothetical protein